MSLKAEIARREIKLFVVKRIVGDVHLAILAGDLAGGVDHHGRVVINAGGALFEERGDDHDLLLLRDFAERFGRWTGNGFGQFEELDVFRLAEVLRAKELLQDKRSARRAWRRR